MTGEARGIKVAGGIRTTKDALRHLILVNETLGADWLSPERYRIGASGLLTDLLMQRQKLTTGVYGSADRITLD
jgi:deoxyribose-phosphate aldolase